MRKNVRYCYNHPYVRAISRCYHCKKTICKECLQHLDHHYFCSKKCYGLYLLSNFLKYVKTHQSKAVLFWNILLSVILLWLLIFGIDSDDKDGSIDRETSPVYEIPISSNILKQFDSLFKQGRNIRSKVLKEKVYNLNIPLQKGWVINVWKNDWPIISQPILKTDDYQFPVQLVYGQNNLRIAVWDANQTLVFRDQYDILYSNAIVEMLRRPVERGDQQYARISLTFDAGANASGAKKILDALQERGIKTTLFLSGQFILKFPKLVERMVHENHEIANHTFNHPHLTSYEGNGEQITLDHVNREFISRQLISTDSVFYELTGQHMAPFWRAPFGEYNQQILDWAAECGYMHVRWTKGFDTFDWVEDKESPIYKTPQQVFESIVSKDNDGENLNGTIVLMHLGSNRNRDPVYEIVPELIDELRSRGYAIVPISDLISREHFVN